MRFPGHIYSKQRNRGKDGQQKYLVRKERQLYIDRLTRKSLRKKKNCLSIPFLILQPVVEDLDEKDLVETRKQLY